MLRVVETFSGIGSQAKALRRLGLKYEILHTAEWDISASYAYDIIHHGKQDLRPYDFMTKEQILEKLKQYQLSSNGKTPVKSRYIDSWSEDSLKRVLCAMERSKNLGSITQVTGDSLPRDIDLLTYSFPCQDLSICGSWHGNMTGIDRNVENRSGMLWEIERILKERKEGNLPLPQFLLMENVNNILSPKHIAHFQEWQNFLVDLGYINQVYTLNAVNFSNPQKRIRTYMLSVHCQKREETFAVKAYFENNNLEKQAPLPKVFLKDYLRTDYSVFEYKEEADWSNRNDTPSRRMILQNAEVLHDGTKTIVNSVKTLTTKQDRHPTSGVIMYPGHREGGSEYRNLSPRECFLLMGFDEKDYEILVEHDFLVRKNTPLYTRERLERLAGNSIVVEVLMSIFTQVHELQNVLEVINRPKKVGKRNNHKKKNNYRRNHQVATM